jgi:hypothetical protein
MSDKIKAGLFLLTIDSLKSYVCPDCFRDAKFGILAAPTHGLRFGV